MNAKRNICVPICLVSLPHVIATKLTVFLTSVKLVRGKAAGDVGVKTAFDLAMPRYPVGHSSDATTARQGTTPK